MSGAQRTTCCPTILLAAAGLCVLSLAGLGVTRAAGAVRAPAPTYRDVAPIFAAKCASCHVLGGIAPFPLRNARDAIGHARAILAVTHSGAMPPWPPSADSPAYIGQSKRILTAQEKLTIERWVRGGAKR